MWGGSQGRERKRTGEKGGEERDIDTCTCGSQKSVATTHRCELWRVVIDVQDPHTEDGRVRGLGQRGALVRGTDEQLWGGVWSFTDL